MGVRFKDLKELAKYGVALDHRDPSRAVPIGQVANGQQCSSAAERQDDFAPANAEPNTETTIQPPGLLSLQNVESFARETLSGAVGDISTWDDQAVLAGIEKECATIRALDANYPAQYHRLGTLIIEGRNRFGDENVKQRLRQEGIDSTRAWRAEQIASLYTYDQAVAFPSLRAILGTLPARQPRTKTPNIELAGGGDQATAPEKSPPVSQKAEADETILESFIRLGIKVVELFGDGTLDQAVEQIRAHVPQTFEEAFVEV